MRNGKGNWASVKQRRGSCFWNEIDGWKEKKETVITPKERKKIVTRSALGKKIREKRRGGDEGAWEQKGRQNKGVVWGKWCGLL